MTLHHHQPHILSRYLHHLSTHIFLATLVFKRAFSYTLHGDGVDLSILNRIYTGYQDITLHCIMEQVPKGSSTSLHSSVWINREVTKQTYLLLFLFWHAFICTFSVTLDALYTPVFTVGIGQRLIVVLSRRLFGTADDFTVMVPYVGFQNSGKDMVSKTCHSNYRSFPSYIEADSFAAVGEYCSGIEML